MELTPNVTDLIFGGTPPAIGDPAEDYMEASKLHRRLSAIQVPGVHMLESNPWMIEATARAGRSLDHRPAVELPEPSAPPEDIALRDLLLRRRSPEQFRSSVPALDQLSRWCWAGAGRTRAISLVHHGRTYPSGGAMFPCDVFVSLNAGDHGPAGTWSYDPDDHRLLLLNDRGPADYGATTPQPESFESCSAVWIITSALWRSRFKYGQRSLRFSLLEAGHIAQNLILAVGADGQAGRPIGGFFDDELADALGMDSLHEVPLYLIITGADAEDEDLA